MTRAASGPELRWRICVTPAEDDLVNFRDVMELSSTRAMHLLICSRLSLSLSPPAPSPRVCTPTRRTLCPPPRSGYGSG